MSKSSATLPAETEIGTVALTVPDLGRAAPFYRDLLGLTYRRQADGTAWLGTAERDLVMLVEEPGAQPPGRATGLYHQAFRLPSRLELARSLNRLLEARWPIQGAADHGVSEALYLSDPVGNDIEIYRDYPRERWPVRNGQIQMVSEQLDVEGVMAELNKAREPSYMVPPGTVMGHVHLKVSDLQEAVDFYTQVLGFDLIQRFGSSAAFVSAGGYHHHIGMNTWESAGAPPPAPGSIGLRFFTVRLPSQAVLDEVQARLQAAGVTVENRDGGLLARDPSENGVLLEAWPLHS
jgi:catechol 2,3-dioxygenase